MRQAQMWEFPDSPSNEDGTLSEEASVLDRLHYTNIHDDHPLKAKAAAQLALEAASGAPSIVASSAVQNEVAPGLHTLNSKPYSKVQIGGEQRQPLSNTHWARSVPCKFDCCCCEACLKRPACSSGACPGEKQEDEGEKTENEESDFDEELQFYSLFGPRKVHPSVDALLDNGESSCLKWQVFFRSRPVVLAFLQYR